MTAAAKKGKGAGQAPPPFPLTHTLFTFSCNAILRFVDCLPLQLIYVTQLPKGI